jgi:hypothetical protein
MQVTSVPPALKVKLPQGSLTFNAGFEWTTCADGRAPWQNHRGSWEQENRHRMEKGNHEKKELEFSSYLVQTAPKIVRRISRNQLVKIKGEEAPPKLQQTKFK